MINNEATTSSTEKLVSALIFILVVFIFSYRCWIRSNYSLWLDETLTYWAIDGDLWTIITRTYRWMGQSPFYFVVLKILTFLFGTSEPALRFISMLSIVGTAFFIYKIAEEWFDKKSAQLALLFFLCNPETTFFATNARPYAIGLFFLTASVWFLALFIKFKRSLWLVLWILSTTLTVYSHYLFAGIVVVHLIYIFLSRNRIRDKIHFLLLSTLSIALLLLPILPQFYFLQFHKFKSFAEMPTIFDLPRAWARNFTVLILLAIFTGKLLFMCIKGRAMRKPDPNNIDKLYVALSWWLLPAFLVYSISIFLNCSIFVGNYCFWQVPGQAICMARLSIYLFKGVLRYLVILLAVLLSCITNWHNRMEHEDWREAARLINNQLQLNPSTPVLFSSGHTETQYLSFLVDPERKDIMLSPLHYYPLISPVVLLPFRSDSYETRDYLNEELEKLASEEEILLLIPNLAPDYLEFLHNYFKARNYVFKNLANDVRLEGIEAGLFSKDKSKDN